MNKFGLHLIPGTNRDYVGIDFNSDMLKIAYIKTSAMQRGLINLISQDIKGLSDDEIAEKIKTFLVEAKVINPNVITLIPANLGIIKNIEIPSVNPQEIKEIVDLQAARHTPYSAEEIIISYVKIGVSKSNYTRILLVIVNQEIVRKQFEILKKAHLNIERVIFEPEGINSIVCKILQLESQELPLAIIHIDKFSSDFIISLKNKIIFTRSISLGAQQFLQDKEKYMMDLKGEIKKSLETYQSEEIGEPINMLVLSGAINVFQQENLAVSLKDFLGVPVKTLTYDNFPVSEKASKLISEAKNFSFLDVIAPIMTSEQLQVDLIPEEVKIQRVFKERSKNIIQTGVLIITILVLIGGILISKIYFKELYLKRLIAKYQPIDQKSKTLEKTFDRVQIVRNYLSQRGNMLEVLSQLYDLIPPEIYLNEIKIEREGTFSIKGTSNSMASVFSFITNMEKSNYYKDVKTKYTTKREEKGENLVDFEIVSILE